MNEADYLKEIGDVLNKYLIENAAEITEQAKKNDIESNLVVYAYQKMFQTNPVDEQYQETLDAYMMVVFKYLWMKSGRSTEVFSV